MSISETLLAISGITELSSQWNFHRIRISAKVWVHPNDPIQHFLHLRFSVHRLFVRLSRQSRLTVLTNTSAPNIHVLFVGEVSIIQNSWI